MFDAIIREELASQRQAEILKDADAEGLWNKRRTMEEKAIPQKRGPLQRLSISLQRIGLF